MTGKARAIALIAFVFLQTACAFLLPACSNPGSSTEPVSLAGSEWFLVSLGGRPLAEGTYITLGFSELALQGSSGCNSYGADYRIVGSEMQLGLMNGTLELCLDPQGVNEQEKVYLDALRRTAAYRMDGDQLVFLKGTGEEILAYARWLSQPMDPADLVGTTWQLVAIDEDLPLEGTTITLSFDGENQLRGNGGCRGFSGRYEAEGDQFRLRLLTMTEMTCQKPLAVQVQEEQFTTHLEQATHYRLSGNTLEMFTRRGRTLRFEAAP